MAITYEEKLRYMRDALEAVTAYINKNYPDAHLSAQVKFQFDGEAWSGSVQPLALMRDTNMSRIDRIFMMRNYRTNTFGELIDQMMATVEFQDEVYKQTLNGGEL
jgi:hypothetical protein